MKFLATAVLLIGLAGSTQAVDRAELDYRIRKLSFKLQEMQAKPDKRIPPQVLSDAKGIILLERTKAGFLFAYQGGNGVVLVRDAQSGRWGPPAFISANEASLGFQIGGQQSFVAIVLMNTNAIRRLADGVFDFGGDARGTAGNVSTGAGASMSSTEPLAVVYSDTAGLYGGVSLRGDALSPDSNANVAYYGQYLTAPEILFEHKVQLSPAATELAQKLDQFSR